MKAIKVLTLLTEEVKKVYETVEDFCGWCPQNSNVEARYLNEHYVVDFWFSGKNDVSCTLSYFKNIDGKWVKSEIDNREKEFIESAFCGIVKLWYEVLISDMITMQKEQDEQIQADIDMMDTYKSMSTYR